MKSKLTKSAQQTVVFFEEFIRKNEVADFIKRFRQYLNLPQRGLSFTEEDKNDLVNYPLNAFLYIPQRARSLFPKIDREKPMRIINTCKVFVKQQGVDSFYIDSMLTLFLFFNKTIDIPLRISNDRNDLLKLEHIPSELSWFSNKDHYLLKRAYEHFDYISKKYPIALYINPKASQRQIQDFLAKNWSFIKTHEKDVKTNVSGHKKKNKSKQERNDFIYQNRNLPRKKIMEMIIEEFPSSEIVDYGYIGKIISLEKKRRENK